MAIWWRSSQKQGHVAFVYGTDSKTDEIIVLGEHQNNSLNFMLKIDTSKGLVGFYMPETYDSPSNSVFGIYDIVELNKEINYNYTLPRKYNARVR